MNEPIDFVIIWVDGNDKKWQEEKNKYYSGSGDSRTGRYRNWENLKYWFRGVEKYANWVNKVFFVTCGHLPDWLNVNHPKLCIIKHDEYIPNKYLPTFSSHPIEINLHRIKDLSEKFVYFNDDMFLIKKVKPTDFFINGLPRDAAIMSPAIKENKFGIGNVELNNMAIINTYFSKKEQIKKDFFKWFNVNYQFKHLLKNLLLCPWKDFTGFYEFHLPSSFLKKTFEEVWEKEFKELDETSSHKFRDLKLDVNQWLFRDWQLAKNEFIPRKTSFGKLYTINNEFDIDSLYKDNKSKMVCINDGDKLDEKSFPKLQKLLTEYFEKNLSDKSSFEK